MISPENIQLPVKFDIAGSHLLVHLTDPNKLDLSLGFFRDSLNSLPNGGAPDTIVPLSRWLKEEKAEAGSPGRPIGIIFHMARCGSTLLCQNLKAAGGFLVLGEPAFTGRLFKPNSIIPAHLKARVAQKTLAAWNDWANRQGKSLVIKLSSALLPCWPAIIKGFPGCRALFLHREPVAVVESLVRKPTGFMRNRSDHSHLFEFNTHREAGYSAEVVTAATVYSRYIEQIPHSNLPDSITSVDYRHLARRFGDIIYFFLGKSSNTVNPRFSWSTEWYAKSKSRQKERYVPLPEQKLQEFYEDNRDLLDILARRHARLAAPKAGLRFC